MLFEGPDESVALFFSVAESVLPVVIPKTSISTVSIFSSGNLTPAVGAWRVVLVPAEAKKKLTFFVF